MEVLPLSSRSTAVDCGPSPRSATFQPRRSSRSLMRPQTSHSTRVSVSRGDRNRLDRFNMTISDHELPCAGSSYLLTLSPIIASPRGTPTSTFSLDSSASDVHHDSPPNTQYVTTPMQPILVSLPSTMAPSESTPPHAGSRSLSEALYAPSSLSTSTSYPAAVFLRTVHDVVAPQETRHHVRHMNRRPRSFSDSSLPSRLAFHSFYSEQPGISLRSEIRQTNAEDINASFPRHRAKFHIPLDQNSEEDEGASPLGSYEPTQNLGTSCHSNIKASDNVTKDATRRFHALMELLTSECGYLNDLKALVQVYLRNLSGMTYRAQSLTRVPSFLATSAWIGSHSSLQSYSQLCDVNSAAVLGKDRSSAVHRRLFTESEVKLLARNAEELLCLHEGFMQELEATVRLLGIVVDPLQGNIVPNAASIDFAIGAIARIFAQQASRFHVYQDFCAGHLEALQIIRTKQHQHPVEWNTFELQCARAIQSGSIPEPPSSVGPLPDHKMLSASDRKRTTSLDGAIRSLRVFTSRENMSSSCDVRHNSHARRLMFMDYLIKPVQRICKYSLLLEQLRPVSKDVSPDVGSIVKESIQAMKDIVATVDEARHRKDITVKSSLIASRILRSTASGYSHSLSDVFLSSLGNCLLAGSLTVVHQSFLQDFTSAKPKNLGAFLYPGGYLILAKVLKGKVYEPKHWFCLADFDVQDISTDATSPSTFCLHTAAHVFELTAACPGEKSVWLSTIRVSLSQPQGWIDEPISSMGLIDLCSNDFKPSLPTTQSDSGCCPADQDDSSCSPSSSAQNCARLRQDCNLASTRTSSSVSLKTLFCPSTDMNFVVRRYSMTEKQQTDDGLRDVAWRACIDARVCRHDFQGVNSSFARSSSTVSLKALTRSRFSRRESVTVSRHNSLPNGDGFVSRKELMKAKSTVARRGNRGNKDVTNISGRQGPLYARPGTRTDQIIPPQSINLADSVDDPAQSPSHDLFRNVKDLFQAPSTSAIDNVTLSVQKSPIQRAKSTNSIFRRLSSRVPFRRGVSSDVKRGMS